MDSASEPVLGYYAAAGVQVEALPEDQDSTDLHKCLAYAERRLGQDQLRQLTVLVLGECAAVVVAPFTATAVCV